MQNARNITMMGRNRKPTYWGLTFTAEQANSTISMTKGANAPTLSLVTSVNGGKTWETFTSGETTITLAKKGDSVWFAAGESGNDSTASSATLNGANTFSMTGSVSAIGSVMSLLNASEPTYICGSQYTFTFLFYGCSSLTTAPELPATTLANACYYRMFQGCSLLTTAPKLPAMTLKSSCYNQMFSGCTSLKQTPDLPATTANAMSYVYYRMFDECTGLERTDRIAIETATGTSALDMMFYRCSNLTYIELSGMTAWSTRMTNWVNGVSATGTFKCLAALGTNETITRGTSNCPEGWTVENF